MGNFMALAAAELSRKAAHDHKSKRTMRTASALISQRRPAIRFIRPHPIQEGQQGGPFTRPATLPWILPAIPPAGNPRVHRVALLAYGHGGGRTSIPPSYRQTGNPGAEDPTTLRSGGRRRRERPFDPPRGNQRKGGPRPNPPPPSRGGAVRPRRSYPGRGGGGRQPSGKGVRQAVCWRGDRTGSSLTRGSIRCGRRSSLRIRRRVA